MSATIEKIDRIGFVEDDRSVILECRRAGKPLHIEFPLPVFYRLIALTLQLAGRLPETKAQSLVALKPDEFEVVALEYGAVGLQLRLPGGSPLTFQFDRAEASELGRLLAATAAEISVPASELN